MITLFEIWEQLQGGLNAHQNGFIRPNRNLVNWVSVVQQEIYTDLRDEYEKSQIISDFLTPFLVTKNIIVPRLSGQMWDLIKFPPDYDYFAAARSYRRGEEFCGVCDAETVDGRNGTDQATCPYMDEEEVQAAQDATDDRTCELKITKVPTAKWGSICERKTLKPSLKAKEWRAYCTQFDKGLKLIPKGIGIVVVDYFRKPAEATFEYTIKNANTEDEYIEFNANTSIGLEWDRKLLPEFIARLEKKYGKATGNQQFVQTGTMDSKIG